MIALADWIRHSGSSIHKVYVTSRLPSSKGNVRGVLSMLWKSGWAYTHFKVWANRILPMQLRRRHLPACVADYLRACGLGCPVEHVDSVNTEQVVSEIRAIAPAFLVSFSATQRFKDPLMDVPSLGAINTHYGALPRYAGLSPYFWHLHNKEEAFGVTLHRIVSRLDAGPIIEQATGAMAGAATALEVMLRMAALVSPMLKRFFDGQTTLVAAQPQRTEGRTYFAHPTRRQMRLFHRNGFRMKDTESVQRTLQRVGVLAEQVGSE